MNRRHLSHLMPPFATTVLSTPEQEAEALGATRSEMIKIRDLARDLELPATSLGLVCEIYFRQLSGVMHQHMEKLDLARQEKITALRTKGVTALPDPRNAQVAHARMTPMTPLYASDISGMYDGLEDISDAELDKLVSAHK